MAKRTGSTKNILLEHSKVKAELYASYLDVYLSVLTNTSHINKIYILDLMCGEGIYENGGEGTSVRAFHVVKRHFKSGKNINISLVFNDNGFSDVEKGRKKIDRVEEYCESYAPHPKGLEVFYLESNFIVELYPNLLKRISALEDGEKMLLLLDPYGYKDLQPNVVKEILTRKSGCVELLLFLPLDNMARFAKKVMGDDKFPGGAPLKAYLGQLFSNSGVEFKGVKDFFKKLISAYDELLDNEFFVNDFKLKTKDGNIYALLFFTPHIRGMEKFIETKWKYDPINGTGYDPKNQKNTPEFFPKLLTDGYIEKLINYILSKEGTATNRDLYVFTIKHGYRNTDTKQALDQIKKDRDYILDVLEGDKKARGYYLDAKNHSKRDKRDGEGKKNQKIVTFKLTKKFKK